VSSPLIIAGCVPSTTKDDAAASAPSGQLPAQSAPYPVATQWAVPKCSKYGSGERLIFKGGDRKGLKPALDYFLRTHDLSECWFVDIFTDENALAEFKRETSASAGRFVRRGRTNADLRLRPAQQQP
jgi:hypothetical protein